MGVMAVIESQAGQMDLHMALNYSRNDDKRYKNAPSGYDRATW
jgi:hypothetical protein